MMDLRDSTSLRNYELIKEIYENVRFNCATTSPQYTVTHIKKLIEKERPELAPTWRGAKEDI
jgi:hypothetical protein